MWLAGGIRMETKQFPISHISIKKTASLRRFLKYHFTIQFFNVLLLQALKV